MTLITDKLIVAGQPTVNGRVYPRKILEKAVREFQASIADRPVYSTLRGDHPATLSKVAVQIVNVGLDKTGDLWIEMATLDTAEGRKLANLIETSGRQSVVIGPVGYGGVIDQNGVQTIVDYRLYGIHVAPTDGNDI